MSAIAGWPEDCLLHIDQLDRAKKTGATTPHRVSSGRQQAYPAFLSPSIQPLELTPRGACVGNSAGEPSSPAALHTQGAIHCGGHIHKNNPYLSDMRPLKGVSGPLIPSQPLLKKDAQQADREHCFRTCSHSLKWLTATSCSKVTAQETKSSALPCAAAKLVPAHT